MNPMTRSIHGNFAVLFASSVRLLGVWFAIMCSAALAPVSTASGIPATHEALRTAQLPPLIPVRDFAGGKLKRFHHRLSFDGQKLAWIEKIRGRRILHLRILPRPVVSVLHRVEPTFGFTWLPDNRRVVFVGFADDRRTKRLYVADTDEPNQPTRDITPAAAGRLHGYEVLRDEPNAIIVTTGSRKHGRSDLYEVDLDSGRARLVAKNNGKITAWIPDSSGRLVARVRPTDDRGWELQAARENQEWVTVLSGTYMDFMATAAFVADDNPLLYMRTTSGRDAAALIALDLDTGRQVVLFEPPRDILPFRNNHAFEKPLWVSYDDPLPRYHFLDDATRQKLDGFVKDGPNIFELTSASLDQQRFIIKTESDRQAGRTYLIDARSGSRELLSDSRLNRHIQSFSERRPIRYHARDGLLIHGTLTIPKGTSGKRLPLVLKVHGGPWGYRRWDFDITTQFFANRGYAVLQVNFRGSRGYGRGFLEKGRREFGKKMQDDLLDAVDWAVAEGYADPDKVAIHGHSFGGYAALLGLTHTPRKFAAGISAMGISDLRMYINELARSPRVAAGWKDLVGDPNDPADNRMLKEYSPITRAQHVERPVLLFHGERDRRVPRKHSEQFVDELRKSNIPVEYVLLPGEGHVFSRRSTITTYYRRTEVFLAKHLGGRAETGD